MNGTQDVDRSLYPIPEIAVTSPEPGVQVLKQQHTYRLENV